MIFEIAVVFILAFVVSDGSHYYFSSNPSETTETETDTEIDSNFV